jgi:hypothetical protein
MASHGTSGMWRCWLLFGRISVVVDVRPCMWRCTTSMCGAQYRRSHGGVHGWCIDIVGVSVPFRHARPTWCGRDAYPAMFVVVDVLWMSGQRPQYGGHGCKHLGVRFYGGLLAPPMSYSMCMAIATWEHRLQGLWVWWTPPESTSHTSVNTSDVDILECRFSRPRHVWGAPSPPSSFWDLDWVKPKVQPVPWRVVRYRFPLLRALPWRFGTSPDSIGLHCLATLSTARHSHDLGIDVDIGAAVLETFVSRSLIPSLSVGWVFGSSSAWSWGRWPLCYTRFRQILLRNRLYGSGHVP